VISVFPRGLNEIRVAWLYYAKLMVVSGRSFGTTYRSHLQQRSIPSSFWNAWPLKIWSIDFLETSVANQYSTLRRIPEYRRSNWNSLMHEITDLESGIR